MRIETLCPENNRKLPGKRAVGKSGEKSIWYRLPIIMLLSLVRGHIKSGHIFRAHFPGTFSGHQNSFSPAEPTDRAAAAVAAAAAAQMRSR
jgi:hypothetical protein